MKLAVTGKGGVGKTTIAGTLARVLSREGQRVLALDGDSNPNLAVSLGIPQERMAQAAAVPPGLTEWREDESGRAYVHLHRPAQEIIADYGVEAPAGVRLLVMGEVIKASVGCRCEAHAVARGITGQLVADVDVAILDLEAGLEHLGRGTAENVDILLIVVEPYFRALATATRVRELAAQLAIPNILVAANRVRTPQEYDAVTQYCVSHQLELVAVLPFDEAVLEAEEQAIAPIDYAPESPAMRAIGDLATVLAARMA